MAKRKPRPFQTWRPTKAPTIKPAFGMGIGGRGFTPFQIPTTPPAGTYDPSLDASARASQRGLAQLTQDSVTGGIRDTSDYNIAQAAAERVRSRGLADIGQSYSRLATGQAQAARAAHVQGGGALMQALAKRTANQNLETSRLNENVDTQEGGLALQLQRATEDRGNALTRAGDENTFFQQDTNAQKMYEAKIGGYNPLDLKDPSEHTRHGITFRLAGKGAKRTYTLPSGQRLNRKQYVKLAKRKGR